MPVLLSPSSPSSLPRRESKDRARCMVRGWFADEPCSRRCAMARLPAPSPPPPPPAPAGGDALSEECDEHESLPSPPEPDGVGEGSLPWGDVSRGAATGDASRGCGCDCTSTAPAAGGCGSRVAVVADNTPPASAPPPLPSAASATDPATATAAPVSSPDSPWSPAWRLRL